MTEPTHNSTPHGFAFARTASLRAIQLSKGSVARVPRGHTVASTARREVAEGKVVALPRPDDSTRKA